MRLTHRNILSVTLVVVFCGTASTAQEFPSEGLSPAELFNARIMPIFRSSDPSSCVQCHLSSVDLKNYILPSHKKTFLSLRDQGLINLETPKSRKSSH